MKTEYFIVSNSFAAPFFSDSDEAFVVADTPRAALEQYARDYGHPAGLYAAACYGSSDDYHKNRDPLARWLCNHERVKQEATKNKGSYSFYGEAPGKFRINDEWFNVEQPKAGSVA